LDGSWRVPVGDPSQEPHFLTGLPLVGSINGRLAETGKYLQFKELKIKEPVKFLFLFRLLGGHKNGNAKTYCGSGWHRRR
jgi:hypothetical protein